MLKSGSVQMENTTRRFIVIVFLIAGLSNLEGEVERVIHTNEIKRELKLMLYMCNIFF